MHVARVRSVHGGREYVSVLLRQSYPRGWQGQAPDARLADRPASHGHRRPRAQRCAARRWCPRADGGLRILRSLPHGHVAAVLGDAPEPGPRADPRPAAVTDARPRGRAHRGAHPGARLKLATARGLSRHDPRRGARRRGRHRGRAVRRARLAARPPAGGRAGARAPPPRCPAAWSCSMSRPPGWRAAAARSRPTATAATTGRPAPDRVRPPDRRRGCPVAVEAFPGNTADPATLEAQLAKLRDRFGLERFVLVGDRGMLTSARIERLREMGGIDWVSALRAPAIRGLVEPRAPSSCRCSTSATSSRSAAPTSRASAWWSAATRPSPRSGRASGRSCWPPPRPTSRGSRRPWRRGTPP